MTRLVVDEDPLVVPGHLSLLIRQEKEEEKIRKKIYSNNPRKIFYYYYIILSLISIKISEKFLYTNIYKIMLQVIY